MSGYVDARELHDDYHREVCPKCGVERWFKRLSRDHWPVDQHNCQRCGCYLRDTLEYPCPECDTRMLMDGDRFECHACGHAESVDRGGLIESMTGEFDTAGYQYSTWQECPVCNEKSILNGPDGERSCDECGKFYAYRFSDAWFCYAIWLRDPDRIRVTEVYET